MCTEMTSIGTAISSRQELNKLATDIYFTNIKKYSTYDVMKFQMLLIFMEIQAQARIDKYLQSETLDKIVGIDDNFKIPSSIGNPIDRTREVQRLMNYLF